MKDGTPPPHEPDHDAPGVPGFRTWAGVYWFVLLSFVAIVAALTVFTFAYR
jgi:hypothetical protein